MTSLLMLGLLVFGVIAYFSLPINDLPAVDYPTINVQASVPGANPDTMASAVATPLERQFTTIAGVESMNSTSSSGSTQITLQFNLNRSMDGAAQDVEAAIIAARPLLPTGMPTPPTFRKSNPSDSPIFFLALSSPTLPLYTVDEYAENMIASRISMVSGVAQVQVYGSQIYAPHVQIDPRKLASYGIGVDEVVTAIRSANVNLPTGTLYGPQQAYNVMANGQLFNATQFRPVIVAFRNGNPVRLSDIGDVIDSVQTDKVASWFNNSRAVVLAVQRQPGTNTIQIVDDIKKMMPSFRALLPGAVKLDIMYDRSQTIRRSVDDVKRTLLITVVLVIAVIFVFLGNPSTTAIASLSLPISIIGTFAAMKLLGFTLNNISLMALTLCVGFVVDDSIVVLENIVRHMELGEDAKTAAYRGSAEIGFTIVSMTISLIAVFLPILLLGGIIGRLFFQFAVTLSMAILISGFVSLSLTPMLCSRFLKDPKRVKESSMHAFSERIFNKTLGWYDASLTWALDRSWLVVLLFVGMVAATVLIAGWVPKGFMPTEDTGMINGTTEALQGVSFEYMREHQLAINSIVEKDNNIQGFMSSVGAGGPSGSANNGRLMIALKPMDERRMKVDQIIQSLRGKCSNIAGLKTYFQNSPAIRIGGMSAKSTYQFSLSCPDTTRLYAVADKFQKQVSDLPGLQDVNTDVQMRTLVLNMKLNRQRMAKLGITVSQVQDALNSAYSSRQVSVIYTPTNQYWVIAEVAPKYSNDPAMLSWLRVRSSSGQLVYLSSLAQVERTVGPQQINHIGQFPAVTVSFNLVPGVSLSQAISEIKDLAHTALPPDVTFALQGTAQTFESSFSNLGVLLVISILVIYIVLGILYESFIHPLTILSGLPSAGLGAMLILLIFQLPLDIYGFLGLILLIGIVKKNAIMMIDYAVDYSRAHDTDSRTAIHQACLTRFRPIMMTTAAALLGSLPIAIGMGQGSESRQPLGLTIIGGLLFSQVVTLFITPVFYIYLDRFQKALPGFRWRRWRRAEEGAK